MAGLRCITLAAVPLALFALQYTQIISFVMISPPLESCTVGCYEHKNETFGPSEVRRRGGGSCKILGMLMTFPCGTFLQSKNIGGANPYILPISRNIGGAIVPPAPSDPPPLADVVVNGVHVAIVEKKKAKNILPINLNPLFCTPPYLMYIRIMF